MVPIVNVCLFYCSLYLVRVLIVVIMGRWSEFSACIVCQVMRLYRIVDIVVMSGEVVCCSVVCGTLVGVSMFIMMCCKWIHKRCSGVRGDLSRVADGFRCRRCDGTIQEVNLAEDLMVDGETYECVKSFCYLGDTLDGNGGADLAATARIRNG